MTKKIGVGKAHSKIILMGEHSVVYGYPAIAIPLKTIEVECYIYPSDHSIIFDFGRHPVHCYLCRFGLFGCADSSCYFL